MTKKDPGKTRQIRSGQLDRKCCLSSALNKQCHVDSAQNTINEFQLLTKRASFCPHSAPCYTDKVEMGSTSTEGLEGEAN